MSNEEPSYLSWDYDNLKKLKNKYAESEIYRSNFDKYDTYKTGIDFKNDQQFKLIDGNQRYNKDYREF